MASDVGTATIDFGVYPGSNETSVAVTGQTAISSTSYAEAFFMSEPSGSHTAADASYAAQFVALTCTVPVAGTGFTIVARAAEKMTGTFLVRWVWSD